MYRNFSEEAIHAIMTAHRLTVEFKLAHFCPEVLLLALIREDDAIRDEAYQHNINEVDLVHRIEAMPKVQLVAFPLTFSDPATELLAQFAQRNFVDTSDLLEALLDAVPHEERKIDSKPQGPPPDPRKWFSDLTYSILADAEKDSHENNDVAIEAHNLAAAAAKRMDWLPAKIRNGISAVRPVIASSVAVQAGQDLSFSEAATKVLCRARELCQNMGADSITGEHIVWAALESINEDLKVLFVAAFHERGRQETALGVVSQTVTRHDGQIWMTPRCHAMLIRARCIATGEEPVTTDYLRALYEEAANSEVAFIENRDKSVRPIVESLNASEIQVPMREIVFAATKRAVALGSERLDINHVALVLLERDEEAVAKFVDAIPDGYTFDTTERKKGVLRRRLEQCLLYQRREAQVAVDIESL